MPREPIDSESHRVLSGVSRVAVLEVLRTSAVPLDVEAVAAQVGLHPNTVRSHLDQLVDAGLAARRAQTRTTPGRPRLAFRAVAQPTDSESEDSYRMLARVLASSIAATAPRAGVQAPGLVAAEAGRRWGHQAMVTASATAGTSDNGKAEQRRDDRGGAVDRVVVLLDDVGFAPRVRPTASTALESHGAGARPVAETVIELHQCPFREVAREHSEVVCNVHLGLIQGALDQMQAPPLAVRLEPFVRPGLCVAHLAPTGTDLVGRVDGSTGAA